MMTSNGFIYLAVLCCLSSTQGLEEMFRNIAASSQDISSFIEQAAAKNGTKSQEFADILNYFVNLNAFEKKVINGVVNLTMMKLTEDDSEKIYGSLDWKTAINDAMQEENVTADFNETIDETVVKYIEHFLSKPSEGLKEKYQENFLNTRRYEDGDHLNTNSSPEGSFGQSKEDNEFWDDTEDIETRRIYGGNRTKIKFFPFMASVQIFDRFSCASSIISSDLVITAASCLQLAWNNRFFRENPAFLSVRVGTHFFSAGGEVIPVSQVFFHPTYVPRTLVNNLAVMRLERHLRFKRRNVKKIDFDRSASALPYNTPGITIIGWGAKTHANKIYNGMVNRIHIAVLDFYDLQSCREVYGKKFVTRTNFCAGFITTGQGACNLDVGDPGVTGRLLVGVASFGSPVCGRKDTPTVFTKIGYYADWIETIMEENVIHGKVRTTSRRPSTIHKMIKIYGGTSDESPIPPLRLLRESLNYSKGLQDDIEAGIPPILDTDPRYEEFEMKQIQRSGENQEDKVPVSSTESMDNMEKESNIKQDDTDDDSMNAKPSVTKAIDTDPIVPIPSETDESDEEVEVKMSTAPDLYTEDDIDSEQYDGAVSTGKRVTGMGIVEPDSDVSDKTPPETNEKDSKEVDSEQSSESEDDALRRKPDILPILDDNNDELHLEPENSYQLEKKHKKNKRLKSGEEKKKKHSTTPIDNANVKSSSAELIEIGPVVNKQLNDSLENDYIKSLKSGIQHHDDDNHIPEPQPEITEELIEREIEKLLSQLDFSTEEGLISKNRKDLDNSQVQNALKNNVRDKTTNDKKKNSDVLTLLYISDSEKDMKPGDNRHNREKGLNIDSEPFRDIQKPNTESNNTVELMAKSEIYDIFAEVMKAVINKTANY